MVLGTQQFIENVHIAAKHHSRYAYAHLRSVMQSDVEKARRMVLAGGWPILYMSTHRWNQAHVSRATAVTRGSSLGNKVTGMLAECSNEGMQTFLTAIAIKAS